MKPSFTCKAILHDTLKESHIHMYDMKVNTFARTLIVYDIAELQPQILFGLVYISDKAMGRWCISSKIRE